MCLENPLFRQEVSIFAVLRRAFVKNFSALCAPNFVCGTNLQFSALFAISYAACSSNLYLLWRVYECIYARIHVRMRMRACARTFIYTRVKQPTLPANAYDLIRFLFWKYQSFALFAACESANAATPPNKATGASIYAICLAVPPQQK